jgi:inosose dehydratase
MQGLWTTSVLSPVCTHTQVRASSHHAVSERKYVKFAPDVGQLHKSGADPAQAIKDFPAAVRHAHLKGSRGGQQFAGYSGLGEGKVDILGILDLLERVNSPANVMVELDASPSKPAAAVQAARDNQSYLEKLGYKFKKIEPALRGRRVGAGVLST